MLSVFGVDSLLASDRLDWRLTILHVLVQSFVLSLLEQLGLKQLSLLHLLYLLLLLQNQLLVTHILPLKELSVLRLWVSRGNISCVGRDRSEVSLFTIEVLRSIDIERDGTVIVESLLGSLS